MPLFSDKKIAIVDHTESRDGRVDNLVEYFENQGANVEVITSNFSHYTKKKITQKKDRYIYIPVITYNKNISLKRIFSHIGFARKVKKTIDNNGYDLVWALVPPNFLLKEINKCKNNFTFVADIEDLWPESLPINNKYKKNILFNTWKNIRNNNLKSAHYIVTECNLYHNYIPANLLFKTKTIYLSQKKVDLGCTPQKKLIWVVSKDVPLVKLFVVLCREASLACSALTQPNQIKSFAMPMLML